jgi:CDP-diacylglycerol--glycerol-3-phosphate 3-phosphatidyltransferase
MISYTRTRAEHIVPTCKVGFLERPERIVLLIIGALFDRMAPVLWVIAVLGTITVIHRMYFTWQETSRIEGAQLREEASAGVPESKPLSARVTRA